MMTHSSMPPTASHPATLGFTIPWRHPCLLFWFPPCVLSATVALLLPLLLLILQPLLGGRAIHRGKDTTTEQAIPCAQLLHRCDGWEGRQNTADQVGLRSYVPGFISSSKANPGSRRTTALVGPCADPLPPDDRIATCMASGEPHRDVW